MHGPDVWALDEQTINAAQRVLADVITDTCVRIFTEIPM
jgi:hypothetical protein